MNVIESNPIINEQKRKKFIKWDNTFLVKFCDEHKIELTENYLNQRVTGETLINAKCIRCDNNMVTKNFRALVTNKNFGCIDCCKIIQYEKAKVTNMEKYGHENPMQCEKVQKKTKVTNIEKYGYENPHAM